MGRTAVSLLNRLLERQRFETLHVELATRLVVRDSDGTAPSGRLIKAGPALVDTRVMKRAATFTRTS